MNSSNKHIIRVGVFTLIGFTIFVAAILFIGKNQNLFNNTIKVSTIFSNVEGLKNGNTVRFTGIDIGTVVDLQILSDSSVRVSFLIQEKAVPFIKKNSLASIGNEGLMGNKMIVILPGTMTSESIEEGDVLESIKPVGIDDIINDVKASTEKITMVGNNLVDITNKINNGEGVFGKIFTDTVFTRNIGKSTQNISEVSANLVSVSEKINKGQGVLGKLFTDAELSHQFDTVTQNMNLITQNINQITETIIASSGIINNTLADSVFSKNILQSANNIAYTTENLARLSSQLNNKNNMFSLLSTDTLMTDSVRMLIYNLNQAILEVTNASQSIQKSGIIRAFSKGEKSK